jgi:hypothetical protein
MENQSSGQKKGATDEIDLGQLIQMIKNGFSNLFKGFLKLFVYIRRNGIKLAILGVIGIAIGFGLNNIVTKKQKTEVIVRPNLESKNYLYDVINEIQANIHARDTSFFKNLEIDVANLKGFELVIQPVEKEISNTTDDDLKYLELLEKFRSDALVADVVRAEILNNSDLNHRITFFYKNANIGPEYAEKLMNYINSNEYLNNQVAINMENARERINQDNKLIAQIDTLINEFSFKMKNTDTSTSGTIVLGDEESLDITGLLTQKYNFIRDVERKKLELLSGKEPIRIINFGTSQEVQKTFLGKNVVLIPLVLIVLFFLIDFVKYLNRKAQEMNL